MPARKAPPWTSEEVAILREEYPAGGLNAAADVLPERSWQAIYHMAWKLGLKTSARGDAPKPRLDGDELEEAIRLREKLGWSFARIGATFGVCESSANNAVLIALCVRKGFRPAARDARGCLTDQGKERLYLMLRKGLKGCDIQLRLGVSASCVAEQRRRYARDLKSRGKAPLPPPGGGERYSGARISPAVKRQIEALYLEGYGTAKVRDHTGVSHTHCLRTRTKLVKRLQRRGEALPGCDLDGTRRVHKDSARLIPEVAKAALRSRLIAGEPVRRAALELGIGLCSAYRIRDALVADLERRGEPSLPQSNWRNRSRKGSATTAAISGTRNIYRFRQLCKALPENEARAQLFAELAAERRIADEADRVMRQAENAARANRSFAEKLDDVASGRSAIVELAPMRRRGPDFTLGGTLPAQAASRDA